MAKIPVFDAIRIIPREDAFLDRKVGSRGEIFYDREALFDVVDPSGIPLTKADLSNITNSNFLAEANSAY